ncbi:ribose/xylose/arabinose/galactoside ABC-type transport system permease subunit [Aequitasia blattaphilus]|uniref:ABC transporter permease n=1 Tax=Aequitasia blattaphilus TaxID=2949332 RepID=A0ABT1EBJ8_9FIRM|nr:ABC transporter permease [Aequitasia blattaphilus]MCP1103014.1 ABC transporter permease [Aequitasia blattaphilus]MCR8615654.1 ABC transporter permease [Aequitasia blattaphilus]
MKRKHNIGYYLIKYKVFLIFAVLFIVMAVTSDFFLTKANLFNMLRQLSINGLLAVGMTFVLITGGIDLSIGAVLTFSAMVGCSFIRNDSPYPVIVCILVTIAIGITIGFINGVVIAKGNVPAFIVTLGTQLMASGGALLFNNGSPIPGLKDSYNTIGAGNILGIPLPIIIFLVVLLVGVLILKRTRFGRYTYAVGGNNLAAEACGINAAVVKIKVYVIAGLCAAIAGIVLSSRVKTATPLAGDGYELDAIAAVVLGGTSLSGGVGSMWGTVVGVLIIGLLNNGMDLLNVQSYFQDIIQGLIIVLAVFIDVNTNKKQR